MRNSTIHRPTFLIIAWFLTGLLLGGSLLSSLPTLRDSAVCAEERVLEVDDEDRSDSFDLDLALHHQVDEHPTSQTWNELQVFSFVQFSCEEFDANSERGPPAS